MSSRVVGGSRPKVPVWAGPVLVAALLTACTGEGSDIGPDLPLVPDATYVVQVADAEGRPICTASVSLDVPDAAPGHTDRSGRAAFGVAAPAGAALFVDGRRGSAVPGDLFDALLLQVPTGSPPDEPLFVVQLADLSGSAPLTLPTGFNAFGRTLDDSAWSGAVLRIAPGTSVLAGPPVDSVELRSGSLPAGTAVPLPRLVDGRAPVANAAIQIAPLQLSLDPGAQLEAPNDLGLPAGAACALYRTSLVDGAWELVGPAEVGAGGDRILSEPGAVTHGGLYRFAVAAASTTDVVGQLTRGATEAGQEGVLVRCGDVVLRTPADGKFTLASVAATDAVGSVRELDLRHAGGRYLTPGGGTQKVTPLPGAATEVPPIGVTVRYASDVRVLLVGRGRTDPWRALGMNSIDRSGADFGIVRGDAAVLLQDIPSGPVSYLMARPSERYAQQVDIVQGIGFVGERVRISDLRGYFVNEPWIRGWGGGTSLWTIDRRGGGLLDDVRTYRRTDGGPDEFIAESNQFLVPRMELGPPREASCTYVSSADGVTIHSAFSVRDCEGVRLELPLRRAGGAPFGEFDPFALVRGSVPAGPGAEPFVEGRGTELAETWVDRIIGVLPGPGREPVLPRRLDLDVAGGRDFEVGVSRFDGVLLAGTVDDSAAGPSLRSVSILDALQLDPGAITSIDFDPNRVLPVTEVIGLPQALVGREDFVDPSGFTLALAAEFGDRRLVQIGRGLVGHVTPAGTDAALRVPSRRESLAGVRLWAVLAGEGGAADGSTVIQRSIHRLDAGRPADATPLLAAPRAVDPAPGGSAPAAGFELRFEAPADATWIHLRLVAESTAEIREWQVLLPPGSSSFDFRDFPGVDGARIAVLAPGTYTVELTAGRVDRGPVLQVPLGGYQGTIAFWWSIGAAERPDAAVTTTRYQLVLSD